MHESLAHRWGPLPPPPPAPPANPTHLSRRTCTAACTHSGPRHPALVESEGVAAAAAAAAASAAAAAAAALPLPGSWPAAAAKRVSSSQPNAICSIGRRVENGVWCARQKAQAAHGGRWLRCTGPVHARAAGSGNGKSSRVNRDQTRQQHASTRRQTDLRQACIHGQQQAERVQARQRQQQAHAQEGAVVACGGGRSKVMKGCGRGWGLWKPDGFEGRAPPQLRAGGRSAGCTCRVLPSQPPRASRCAKHAGKSRRMRRRVLRAAV